jgi:NADPH-dependent curcumin reductase CurA
MIASAKILGQSKPAATSVTVLYTAPLSGEAQGTVTCCNQSTSTDTVKISLVKAGDSTATPPAYSFVVFATSVPSNGVLEKSFDIGAGDSVVVSSAAGSISFIATGLELK